MSEQSADRYGSEQSDSRGEQAREFLISIIESCSSEEVVLLEGFFKRVKAREVERG